MNPLQIILNKMINTLQIQNNPMANNAMNMYKNGDSKGLEEMAKNLCKENGTTPDEVKSNILKQLGIK